MKKLLFLLVLLHTASYPIYSQNFKTKDFHDFGNTGWETIAATATDADGNYYVCGSFTGTLQLGGQTVTSNGKRDIFLARVNDAGGVWLKNYGGPYDDNAYSLLVDNGTIYLAGSFKKEITLGAVYQSQQFTDVFVAKLSADGSVLKANTIACESPAQPAYLQKGDNGNIIIAGSFKKSVNIGGTILNATGNSDIYYASFNENIDFENPQSFGGTGDEQLYGFLVSPSGNKYFVGSFEESLQVGSTLLGAIGKTDGFLIRLDDTGQTTLAKQYGGSYNDLLKCIALDIEGNIYLAGEFGHGITINNNPYSTQKKQDVFLVKLSTGGSHIWERTLGGNSFNSLSSLEMAQNGYFYISGGFRGELHGLQSARNSKDAYIRRYQADGLAGAPIKAGHNNEDNLLLKSFPSGELLATGYFSNAFGLEDLELTDKNYKDLFVGKLVDCESMPGIDILQNQVSCASVELSVEDIYSSYSWSNLQTANNISVNESGTYSLTVTDQFSCTFDDEIAVTIENSLPINLGENTTICEGNNLVLDAGVGFTSYLWDDGSTGRERTVDASGTYSVTASNGTGCGSGSIQVMVNPLPVFELGETIYLPEGVDLFLDPGLVGDYTYLWTDGSTGSTLSLPRTMFSRAAYIDLTVSDPEGCSYYDKVLVKQGDPPVGMASNQEVTDITTNIEQNKEDIPETFKVYPNPSTGKFFLSVSDPEKVKQVDVFSMRGNKIKTYGRITNFPFQVNLSNHPKGTYLVIISEVNHVHQYKIVVE